MTNQFDLTDDQREIQELARRFTADRITPFAGEWDEKHHFPRDVVQAAAELGFGAIYVSEESGGIGLGRLEAALIMEAMAYGCPSTSAFISIHNMAAWMLDRFGSAEIKDRYLPRLVGAEWLASYCLTEPSSGSDAAALKTRAMRDGDHYVVTGTKQFISGGGENELYLVMCRTGEEGPKGISCLAIERDMPGVSFGANEKKLGWHSQPTRAVILEDVRVPVANLVGAEGEGFRIAMMGLDGGRLNIGACSLGGAQRCLDEAVSGGGEGDGECAGQDAVRGDGEAAGDRYGQRGGRPRASASRRLRLSSGLSDRAFLARPARPFDPRGDEPGDAHDRRPRPAAAVTFSILPGTGRGTMRSMVEGGRRKRSARGGPPPPPPSAAVPLPVPGRIV